jgi:mRNA interferase MazF
MIGFEFGDVVVVRFPFSDEESTKQRPAVVVSGASYNAERPGVIVLALSSRAGVPGIGDCPVLDWEGAGLLRQSFMRPLIATVSQDSVRSHLGRLSQRDSEALRRVLGEILG